MGRRSVYLLIFLAAGVVSAGGLLLFEGYASGVPFPGGGGEHPPIVLVTIESTQPEHLGPCYGYHRRTAPNICALAEDGVLFTRAYSQGSKTAVAIPSLITSLPPNSVGLPTFGPSPGVYVLNISVPTLPERLAREGYETLGWGLKRGGFGMTVDREMQDYNLSLWSEKPGPTFFWMFPVSPHYPLDPPDAYRLWDASPLSREELYNLQDANAFEKEPVWQRLGEETVNAL